MRRLLGKLLVTAGLVLMVWPAVTVGYGIYWQGRLTRDFARAEAAAAGGASMPVPSPASARTPVPRPATVQDTAPAHTPAKLGPLPHTAVAKVAPRVGAAVARLRIAAIDLDAIVIEGTDRPALRRGPGHVKWTALPGDAGNCAIAAHRASWFRRLPDLAAGDPVWVETPGSKLKYVVQKQCVVTPDRSDLLDRGPAPSLTLITCTEARADSEHRVLVFCRQVGAFPR
jgi:LPXTG-site transpeptidase (sortase) family protein